METKVRVRKGLNVVRAARRSVRGAWEDLKNEPKIREKHLHEHLQVVEKTLLGIEEELLKLLYKEGKS